MDARTAAAGTFLVMFPPNCSRYLCVVRKSYQDNDSVISTVTTKVKGFAFTNTSDMDARLWDVADYVIPPQVDSVPVSILERTHSHRLFCCHLMISCFHRGMILSLC